MNITVDISAYLNRIHYQGSTKPTYDTLCGLQKAHLLYIPFENLDIHYDRPIELDIDKIFEKVVLRNRGGFCYELNGLFYELLVALGFQVRRISGRVYGQSAIGEEYDHMALIVTLDDAEYLTDVGFGEFAFYPLPLVLDKQQQDPRGSFMFDRYDETYWRANQMLKGKWTHQYLFTTKAQPLEAYAAMCHYHQTSPDSHFTQNRLISRPTPNGRITLSGDMLKVKEADNSKEIRLKGEAAFKQALWNHFRVKVEGK